MDQVCAQWRGEPTVNHAALLKCVIKCMASLVWQRVSGQFRRQATMRFWSVGWHEEHWWYARQKRPQAPRAPQRPPPFRDQILRSWDHAVTCFVKLTLSFGFLDVAHDLSRNFSFVGHSPFYYNQKHTQILCTSISY